MFVLRFIAFDTRLHYIISEYWRTGRRWGGNNQNFVPPPVEADTNGKNIISNWLKKDMLEHIFLKFLIFETTVFLILNNNNMSGRGKGKSSKKAVSR